MSEKIKDGLTGGTYPSGNEFELFAPSVGRLGVTGKFNLLIDEVGQITSLTTTDKTNIVNAINETKTKADASVKLNSTPQNLVGTYTFGTTTGTADKVLFKHDVEFQGAVQFNSGAGDTLALTNNYISLGSETSVTPVGDGGIIFERGLGIQDARVYWDESTDEWKIKPGTALAYPILHTGVTNSNGLNFLLTGDLNSVNAKLTGYFRITKSSGSTNGKTWEIKPSSGTEDLIIGGISDNASTTYEAIRILRSGSNINGLRITTNGVTRLTIDNTNLTSTLPIKVNSIVENTTDNGVLIDSLIIKDEGILNSTTRLVNFLNTGSLFNPISSDLDFTINGNGTQALFIDAGTSQIFNRYDTYLDQALFVNTITQRSSGGITFNSIANFPNNINVTNTQPTITFNESDQATDTKVWDIRSVGGLFRINAINDANSSTKPAYSITKTTNSPTAHDFYIGDNINLKLTSNKLDIGSSILDTSSEANLISKNGFNATLYFKQSTSNKGAIEYIDSTNLFKINRYADVGGSYLGGIDISEISITVKTLPMVVETSLSTNSITPFSGTITTVNQNLEVTGNLSTANNKLIFGTNSSTGDRLDFNDSTNEFTFLEDNTVNNSTIVSGKSKLTNTTAPLNTKSTLTSVNSSGELVIASISDDGISSSNIFKNTKSGINTTSQLFYINNTAELTLTQNILTYGSALNNADLNYNINAKAGFNANISIQQASAVKGRLTYVDSTNILGLHRFADIGGSYVGGLQLSETNIKVENLSLDVDTTIKVNSITEYTNNNGVNIDGILIKDGSINITTGNSIQSNGDINLILDNDDNGTNSFSIYRLNLNNSNRLFRIDEAGSVTINSTNDILSLVDASATSAVTAKTYLSFDYSNGIGATINRAGYIGFGSNTNDSLFIVNDTGRILMSSTNIDLTDTDLFLDVPITTTNKSINIGTGSLTMGLSGLYYDSGDIVLKQDISDANTLRLQSVGSMIFNIDNNNNNTGKDFQWRHNGVGYGGSPLMVLADTGDLSLYGILLTNNNNIMVGSGNLSFSTYDSDKISFDDSTNVFSFAADGAVSNSKIATGTVATDTILSSNGQVISTWATFNSVSPPVIHDSYNVSSISKLSTGRFRLNFTNPMPNTNYCVSVTQNITGSNGIIDVIEQLTTSVTVKSVLFNGSNFVSADPIRMYVAINCKQ